MNISVMQKNVQIKGYKDIIEIPVTYKKIAGGPPPVYLYSTNNSQNYDFRNSYGSKLRSPTPSGCEFKYSSQMKKP